MRETGGDYLRNTILYVKGIIKKDYIFLILIVLLTFGFNAMIIDACNKTLAISLIILSILIVIYDFIKGIKRCKNTSLALS